MNAIQTVNLLSMIVAFAFSLPCLIAVVAVYRKSGRPRMLALFLRFYICLALKMLIFSLQGSIDMSFGGATFVGDVVLELSNLVVSVFLLLFLVLFVDELFAVSFAKKANAICAAVCALGLVNIFMPYSIAITQEGRSLEWGPGLLVMDVLYYAGILYAVIVGFRYFGNIEPGRLSRMLRPLLATIAIIVPLSVIEELCSLLFPGARIVAALRNISLFFPLLYFAFNAILLYQGLKNNLFQALGTTRVELSRDFVESYRISPREREIVELVVKGRANKEIADTLFISEQTVKNHLYNIFQKARVSNRMELLSKIISSR